MGYYSIEIIGMAARMQVYQSEYNTHGACMKPKPSELAPPDVDDAYREMAVDDARERDAMEWSEGLIGELIEAT
jgi:hypothetical protein